MLLLQFCPDRKDAGRQKTPSSAGFRRMIYLFVISHLVAIALSLSLLFLIIEFVNLSNTDSLSSFFVPYIFALLLSVMYSDRCLYKRAAWHSSPPLSNVPRLIVSINVLNNRSSSAHCVSTECIIYDRPLCPPPSLSSIFPWLFSMASIFFPQYLTSSHISACTL